MASTPDILDTTTRPTVSYPPHPDGLMPIVCVDVIDMGERIDTMQGKTKIKKEGKFAFVSGQKREDGKYHVIYGKSFTLPGFHEKSNLRRMLEQWRGKKFTDAELPNADTGNPGPDLTKLVGTMGTGNIVHQARKAGGVFAQVDSILPAMAGMQVTDDMQRAVAEYTRADWVAKVKADNAVAVANYRAQNNILAGGPPPALTQALDLEKFDSDDDSLPF